tara:strand:- start:255 stop:812 length:558 start_codon:yes stop_codon:yes gene_type:complete
MQKGDKKMALSKQRKQELVETYTELLQRSQGVVWVNNKGLSVSEISALRHRLREAEGVCRVTKNRLTRLALQEAGLPATEETLSGPTLASFAFGEIPPVAKAISDFAKENDTIEIKGGLMGTQLLSAQEVKTLANLPPLPELRAKLLGLLNSPARGIAGTLSSSVRQVVSVVHAFANADTSEASA